MNAIGWHGVANAKDALEVTDRPFIVVKVTLICEVATNGDDRV